MKLKDLKRLQVPCLNLLWDIDFSKRQGSPRWFLLITRAKKRGLKRPHTVSTFSQPWCFISPPPPTFFSFLSFHEFQLIGRTLPTPLDAVALVSPFNVEKLMLALMHAAPGWATVLTSSAHRYTIVLGGQKKKKFSVVDFCAWGFDACSLTVWCTTVELSRMYNFLH